MNAIVMCDCYAYGGELKLSAGEQVEIVGPEYTQQANGLRATYVRTSDGTVEAVLVEALSLNLDQ